MLFSPITPSAPKRELLTKYFLEHLSIFFSLADGGSCSSAYYLKMTTLPDILGGREKGGEDPSNVQTEGRRRSVDCVCNLGPSMCCTSKHPDNPERWYSNVQEKRRLGAIWGVEAENDWSCRNRSRPRLHSCVFFVSF